MNRENSVLSNASSIIISGRGTSTPLDSTCADFNSRNVIRAKRKLDYVHPKVQYADVPIFGRLNLQLLSEYYAHMDVIGDSESKISLATGENGIGMAIQSNAENADKLQSSENKINYYNELYERYKDIIDVIDKKGSRGTNKETGIGSQSQIPTAKNLINRRPGFSKKTISSTLKSSRSNLNHPSYKVSLKLKSPRRLQSIRENSKKRREAKSIEVTQEEKSKKPLKQSAITDYPNVKIFSPNKPELNFKEKIPVWKRVNESEKEKAKPSKPVLLSTSVIRKKKTENKKKVCQSSAILKCANHLKDSEMNDPDLEKLVVFKKNSRVKSPVKKPQITVPESPKLGLNRRSHSCLNHLKDKQTNDLDLEKPVLFNAGQIRKIPPFKPSIKKHQITVPESPKLGPHRSRSCL